MVVIPDILSKKASLIVKLTVDSINGIDPKIAMKIQANVENKNVCCKLSLNSDSRFASMNNIPKNIVMNADAKKL